MKKLSACAFQSGLFLGVLLIGLQAIGDAWLVEMFTSLRMYYFVPFAAYALFYVCSRKWMHVGLMAMFMLFNLIPTLPLFIKVNGPHINGRLKVVQVNVENTNRDFGELLKWLEQVDPDVVAVEELTPACDLAIRNRFSNYSAYTIPRDDYFGVGLFAKEKLRESESFIPNGVRPAEPALLAKIFRNDVAIEVAAVHTLAPHRPEEMVRRNQQMRQLAEKIKTIKTDVVLLGDLNTVPWSSEMSRFKNNTDLHDTRKGFGIIPTCCVKHVFWVPIDYCLTSKGIRAASVAVGPDIGSDHRPIVIELEL